MATSPNFSWPEPDNTDLVKNGALAIRTAVDAIDASMVDLKGGTTGQVLSKTSNTDMDFTWVAQDDSNAIQNAIVDAKGDIIVATAADTPARLAVGTNGQVLKANSATATGLEWSADSAGMTNPMTTTGDTIYSSSGSTPARLGIGSTGQVLTVAGGVPSWATPAGGSTFAGVSLARATAQTIANSTLTAIAFTSENFDTDGYHDNSVNNTRITIPAGKGGYYLLQAINNFAPNAIGYRTIAIRKNGTTDIATFEFTNAGAGAACGQFLAITNLAVATDYYEVRIFQNSGGNLDTTGGTYTNFSASLLGA